jgi:DNA end-binding protein Ku
MRAVWTGTIGLGTFGIPVKAYSATEDSGVSLNQVHRIDGGRIRYRRVCEVDEAEVPPSEIAKGYQVPGGDVVLLTEEDLASLPLTTAHSIDIRAFAPLDQIDPVYFAKSYFLEPEPVGTKPYVLLSEALQQSGRIAVVRVALRQRETLGALRVRDQLIMLQTMLWPDEIRTPDFPFQHEDVDVRVGEVRAAVSMIEQLAGDFEPKQHKDGYTEALEALIQAKIDGSELVQPTAAAQNAAVAELLAALQNGMAGGSADTAARGEDTIGKAKAAAGKAAAEKSAATKAVAKHGSARTRR